MAHFPESVLYCIHDTKEPAREGDRRWRSMAKPSQPLAAHGVSVMNTYQAITVARKHAAAPCEMRSSALVCLQDAMRLYEDGRYDLAGKWALRSLSYSVGILHADYERVKRFTER